LSKGWRPFQLEHVRGKRGEEEGLIRTMRSVIKFAVKIRVKKREGSKNIKRESGVLLVAQKAAAPGNSRSLKKLFFASR